MEAKLGLLDGSGGNLSKGVIAVLGALLAGKLLSNRIDQPEYDQPTPQPEPRQSQPRPVPPRGDSDDGGLLGGGLGDLLERLRNAGHGPVADSWVQPGENKPIAPRDLGSAMGQKTLSQLAAEAGMSEQELLEQLSRVLPGVVDRLTPDGRVPSNSEVERTLSNSPW